MIETTHIWISDNKYIIVTVQFFMFFITVIWLIISTDLITIFDITIFRYYDLRCRNTYLFSKGSIYIYIPYVKVWFDKLPHLWVKLSLLPRSFNVITYLWSSTSLWNDILISLLRFYSFHYNMLSNKPVWLVIISWIFIVFYFIAIFILAYDSISSNSLLFKINFMIDNPLCTDPQLIWKCKWSFVTPPMAIKSPQPNLSSIIFSCVCFSSLFDEYVNDITVC